MRLKLFDYSFSIIILSLLSTYFYFNTLNVDSSWILYGAEKVLQGTTLYTDLPGLNPPLIYIYSMIPVLLTNLIPVSITNSYIIFIILLVMTSLYLSYRILNKFNYYRYYLYFLTIILIILPSIDFGQREHLFIIFFTPYILMMLYKEQIIIPSHIEIFIIIFAILGLNLKPHFFLMFIGIEIAYIVHKRDIKNIFNIQSFIIILSAFLYIVFIFIYFPQYITFAIPLALEIYVDVFDKSYEQLLLNSDIFLTISLILFWLFFTKRNYNLQIKIFLSLFITSLIIYLIQQKGWTYHLLPLSIINYLFLIHIILDCTAKSSKIYGIIFIPLIIYIPFLNITSKLTYPELENILSSIPPQSKVHIISSDVAKGQSLLLKNDHIWASRFAGLIILYEIINNKNIKLKTYLFNAMREDIAKYNPDVIIFCGKYTTFNYYEYFSKQNNKLAKIYSTNYSKTVVDGYTILQKKE